MFQEFLRQVVAAYPSQRVAAEHPRPDFQALDLLAVVEFPNLDPAMVAGCPNRDYLAVAANSREMEDFVAANSNENLVLVVARSTDLERESRPQVVVAAYQGASGAIREAPSRQ